MMKKPIRALISVIFAFFAAAILGINCFAAESFIDDRAGLYTAEQLEELEARQQEVSDYTGWNIVVVTTNVGFGTDGYDAIEYAENYYDSHFGYSSSGIMYLIDIDYRHFCIAGEADYQYFNDSRVGAMFKACNGKYMDCDDVGNLTTFYDYVIKYYDAGPISSESGLSRKFSVQIAVIVGLAAAAIGVAVVISRYKFHYKPSANSYLDRGKINFYRRSDRFVRQFTTRARIDSDGGGGRGGGHGSSGGHSHGGGGGGGRR